MLTPSNTKHRVMHRSITRSTQRYTEKTENTENTENAENVENAENAENADTIHRHADTHNDTH